ncbi:MAG: hypothetical protein AAF658_12105, partial [Myxococcota bacterium]
MRDLLDELGAPQRAYPCAIIAGTNGKGSACAALADVLMRSGRRVGLYTSPHLLRFSERFQIDGEPIEDDALIALYERVRECDARRVARDVDARPATFFELGTAIALLGFAKAQVDFAVLEVGLGGRLDATNAADRVLSVITPVGLDHQNYLGDTLAEIAGEKAGIIRPKVPLVLAPQATDANESIERVARSLGVDPVRVDAARARGAPRPAPLRLAAATAATAARVLELPETAIEAMLDSDRWHPPAR